MRLTGVFGLVSRTVWVRLPGLREVLVKVAPVPKFAIMGVVNVTPDSFSDGGTFEDTGAAVRHSRRLIDDGADIVDVGGESTRPGAAPVPPAEELERVVPVVAGIAALGTGAQISIDTMKLAVAEAAVDAGATYVNDVTAFRHDPGLAGLVADRGLDCCLMHMLGEPRTMQRDPRYGDVVVRREGVPGGAARRGRGRRHPGGARAARPGHRLRQDDGAQPRAAAAPRRAGRDRPPDRARDLAARRSSAASPGAT